MSHELHLFSEILTTPIGTLMILSDEEGNLRAVDWTDHEERMRRLLARQFQGAPMTVAAASQRSAAVLALAAYFEGELNAVDALPTATAGTPFQTRVWAALRQIPPGQTLSYAGLAKRIGQPAAVRAVGLANGANPINIVVPCHRVIGADGSLTGYGGGLNRKRWLLDHENRAGTGAADTLASSLALPW